MLIFGSAYGASREANRFLNIYYLSIPVELGVFALWMYLRLGHLWLLRDLIFMMGGAIGLYTLYQAFYRRELPLVLVFQDFINITFRGWKAMLAGIVYFFVAFAVPMMASGLR